MCGVGEFWGLFYCESVSGRKLAEWNWRQGKCETGHLSSELGRGHWTQGTGSRDLEAGNWKQGTGGRELEAWTQGTGTRELEAGNWKQGTGGRELDTGKWETWDAESAAAVKWQ